MSRRFVYYGASSAGVKSLDFTIDTSLGDGIASFALPTKTGYNYNFVVDWGDGNSDIITTYNDPNITHTYTSGGVYHPKITGLFEAWFFNNGGDKSKFISLDAWGDVGIVSDGLEYAWFGCDNATSF